MALSLAKVNTATRTVVPGDRKHIFVDVTFDNSYTTGGLSLTPASLKLQSIDWLQAQPDTSGRYFVYDYANQKLIAFAAGGAQVANATDLSAVSTRIFAVGKGPGLYQP